MKKIGSFLIVFLLLFGLVSVAHAEPVNEWELVESPPTTGGEPIELKLKNNSSDKTITIEGPIDVSVNGGNRQTLSVEAGDVIHEGTSIVPSETRVIAEIAAGSPVDGWRPYDSADRTITIDVWAKVDGIDTHFNQISHIIEPKSNTYNLVLHANCKEYVEDSDMSMILSLENKSASPVKISGKAVVGGFQESKLYLTEHKLIGEGPIKIGAGETVEVVKVEAGAPHMWNAFYFPQIKDVKAWFNVEDDIFGWESEIIQYCITGKLEHTGYEGVVEYVDDNEDGTAAIKATLTEVNAGYIITCENGSWSREEVHEELGPARGLEKEDFNFYRDHKHMGSERIGEVVQAQETSPGVYLLTWAHLDGTHEIFLEVGKEDDAISIIPANPTEWIINFEVIISTQNRPIPSEKNEETGKYEGTINYPSSAITFTSDQQITAELNYRRQGETLKELPEGAKSAGIYMEINVASGDLGDCEILLEVDYSRDHIPADMNEKNLRLFRFNEDKGEWEMIPKQEVDTEKKIIRAWLTGFSEFGVFEYETAEETITESDDGSPKTGDSSNIPLYVSLMFISLTGIIVLTVAYMRKRKKVAAK